MKPTARVVVYHILAGICLGVAGTVYFVSHAVALISIGLLFAFLILEAFALRLTLINHHEKRCGIILFWIIVGLSTPFCAWLAFIETTTAGVEGPSQSISLDTNAFFAGIKGVIEKSLANVNDQENPTNYLATRWPGFVFLNLINLGRQGPIAGRNNFIWDVGQNLEKNRISLYVDVATNLCFRIIDHDSQAFVLKTRPSTNNPIFGEAIYVLSEYGSSNDFSFMRMEINGNVVAERHEPWPIVITAPFSAMSGRIGQDISGNNGGIFGSEDFVIFSRTFLRQNEIHWLEYMHGQATKKRGMAIFHGSDGGYWNPSQMIATNHVDN